MASELRVNTLKDASGNNSVATSVVANGSAKAWWSSNDTTLKDSYNIASVTDVAASDYGFNFTANMNNDDFAFPGGTVNTTNNDVLLVQSVSTSQVRQKGIRSDTGAAGDTQPSGATFGDLA